MFTTPAAHVPRLGSAFATQILVGPHPDPVTFLTVQHWQLTKLADVLDVIVDDMAGNTAAESAAEVLSYLTERVPGHDADEEENLLPLLLRRSTDMNQIAKQFRVRHADRSDMVMELSSDLAALASGVIPGVPLNFIVRALKFTEALRRDIAWENCTILPCARRCLNGADYQSLSARMARRRGLISTGVESVAA